MPPTHQRFKDLKERRISLGPWLCKLSERSELSALSVPGSLHCWLPGSVAVSLPGSRAAWPHGGRKQSRGTLRIRGHGCPTGLPRFRSNSVSRTWVLAEPVRVLAEPAGQNLGSSGTQACRSSEAISFIFKRRRGFQRGGAPRREDFPDPPLL